MRGLPGQSRSLRRRSAVAFSAEIEALAFPEGPDYSAHDLWVEVAGSLLWEKLPRAVLEVPGSGASAPGEEFLRWFPGGELNLAYNVLVHRKDENALAVKFSDSLGEEHFQLSFKQLRKKVNLAAAVLKSLGLGKGDTVLILIPNNIEFIIAALACLQLGVAFQSAPPEMGFEALRDVSAELRPKMIFTISGESRSARPGSRR